MTSTNLPGTASTGTVLSGYTFSSASGIDQVGGMPHRGNMINTWCGYETAYVVPHPSDSSQGLVTVPNTYGIAGYYDNSSAVTGNLANLNTANIRAGVRVGMINSDNDATSILGTFTAEHNLYPQYVVQGAWGWANGQRVDGTIPQWGYQYLVPTTYDYVGFPAGQYSQSNQVIAGSGNLTAGNIRSGVNIFNVVGNVREGVPPSVFRTVYNISVINGVIFDHGGCIRMGYRTCTLTPGDGGYYFVVRNIYSSIYSTLGDSIYLALYEKATGSHKTTFSYHNKTRNARYQHYNDSYTTLAAVATSAFYAPSEVFYLSTSPVNIITGRFEAVVSSSEISSIRPFVLNALTVGPINLDLYDIYYFENIIP